MLRIMKMNADNYSEIEDFLSENDGASFFQRAYLYMLLGDQNIVSYYGQYRGETLVTVFMSFHKLWYITTSGRSDYKHVLDYIQDLNNKEIIINDVDGAYDSRYLSKKYKVSLDVRGYLYSYKSKKVDDTTNKVRRATNEDIDDLVQFYDNAPKDVKRGRESILRSIGNGRRTYICSGKNGIEAVALTTGEMENQAMVGGIHYLNVESLSSVLEKTVSDLAKEGKETLIVVRDSIIGDTCLDLRFKKHEPWNMIHLSLVEVS